MSFSSGDATPGSGGGSGTITSVNGQTGPVVTLGASDVSAVPASYLDTSTTLASNSDSKVPTQKAVKTYVDNSVIGLLDLKGSTDASSNPNYPAASKGDAYYVTVAGKIGGASGTSVDVGDVYVANADNAGGTQAAVGTSWFLLEHNLVGALLSANNLSDLTSAAAARVNLGLSASSAKVLYVAQDTGNNSNDGSFFRPFLTIQAAINAANVLAAYYAQVIVLVAPPTGNGYVENLTLSQQGVVLQAMSDLYRSDSCLVRGNLTINLTGTSGGANYIAESNAVYIHGFTFFNGGS